MQHTLIAIQRFRTAKLILVEQVINVQHMGRSRCAHLSRGAQIVRIGFLNTDNSWPAMVIMCLPVQLKTVMGWMVPKRTARLPVTILVGRALAAVFQLLVRQQITVDYTVIAVWATV